MMLLLSLALGATDPGPSYYTHPTAVAEDDLTAWAFTRWPRGSGLWTATDGVPVLDRPGGEALASLGFGEPVVVDDTGPLARVDGRVDVWYHVPGPAPGWVFGGDLTPWRYEADMDEDGELERVTAAWTGEYSVRVRVHEPAIAEGGTLQYDLVLNDLCATQSGTSFVADLPNPRKAGLPLLHLALGATLCGDVREEWLSYTSPGPAKIGAVHSALSLGGLERTSISSTFHVAFSARRGTATVTRRTTPAPGAEEDVLTLRYVLRDGVYVRASDATLLP